MLCQEPFRSVSSKVYGLIVERVLLPHGELNWLSGTFDECAITSFVDQEDCNKLASKPRHVASATFLFIKKSQREFIVLCVFPHEKHLHNNANPAAINTMKSFLRLGYYCGR